MLWLWITLGINGAIGTMVLIYAIKVLKKPPIKSKINLNLLFNESANFRIAGKNWIRKKKDGFWEMYLTGSPEEIGTAHGLLAADLIINQEKIFVTQIKKILPSPAKIFIFKIIIGWLNRNIDKHIGEEYCKEISAISSFASEHFDFIAPRYLRFLNYHAAHDIGHTLNSMHMLGCTSVAFWGNKATNGDLIFGRNFDFYFGDDFSKDKILAFISPEKGYKFAMVTWGGMVGSATGMNVMGLVVCVNGAHSVLPKKSASPVVIIVREVLQYAHDINSAIKILEQKNICISENIVLCSAKDGKAVVVEKSPHLQSVYAPSGNKLICTNHFQSEKMQVFNGDEKTNSTFYRHQRANEIFDEMGPVNEHLMAGFLRNQKGFNNSDIGLGNENCINQLLAHHSVICKPNELLFWINVGPNVLGEYLCYDLKTVFNNESINENVTINLPKNTIPADEFYLNGSLNKYSEYKNFTEKIITQNIELSEQQIEKYITLNPEYYLTYKTLGIYFEMKKIPDMASKYFTIALEKTIPQNSEKKLIQKKVKSLSYKS